MMVTLCILQENNVDLPYFPVSCPYLPVPGRSFEDPAPTISVSSYYEGSQAIYTCPFGYEPYPAEAAINTCQMGDNGFLWWAHTNPYCKGVYNQIY